MRKLVLGLILSILVPGLASGQTVEDSWDNLKQLQPGQKIQVVDMNLKSYKGTFVAVSDEAISLRMKRDEVTVERENVFRVTDRGRSKRLRNVLIGAAIGAGVGLAGGAVAGATYHEEGETGVFMLVYVPVVAGIGAGVGAAFGGYRTIYRTEKRRAAAP